MIFFVKKIKWFQHFTIRRQFLIVTALIAVTGADSTYKAEYKSSYPEATYKSYDYIRKLIKF